MVTHLSSDPEEPGTAVVLRHREQELGLMPGKYLVGRDRNCNLVIDREVVSRRHAYLQVFADSKVILKDLGSHNGVCVNGQTIGDALVQLNPGDWFVIGSEMFEVDPENDLPHGDATKVVKIMTERDHVVLVDSRAATLDDTQASHDIDLMCAIAERTMATGQSAEAEALLTAPLTSILSDALGNHTTSQRVRAKAVHCALRLARGTHKVEWFDYVFDLLLAESVVCTEEQAEMLVQVHRHIGRADTTRVVRYLDLLHREAPTIENLRVAALLDSIVTTSRAQ